MATWVPLLSTLLEKAETLLAQTVRKWHQCFFSNMANILFCVMIRDDPLHVAVWMLHYYQIITLSSFHDTVSRLIVIMNNTCNLRA